MAEKVVFLVGAGASKDAGLPLMADLTTGFATWLTEQKRADDDKVRGLFISAMGIVSPPQPSLPI